MLLAGVAWNWRSSARLSVVLLKEDCQSRMSQYHSIAQGSTSQNEFKEILMMIANTFGSVSSALCPTD